MPSYLRQWFIHRHGGGSPVTLIRGSVESKLLQRATVPLPEGVLPAYLPEVVQVVPHIDVEVILDPTEQGILPRLGDVVVGTRVV